MKLGKIKAGYWDANKELQILGDNIKVNGKIWSPVIFKGDEYPSFQLAESIELIEESVYLKNV